MTGRATTTSVAKYRTIVADPPWPHQSFASMPGSADKWGHAVKREAAPYPVLSVQAICALPVRRMVAPDARLFCWATNLHLRSAFAVLDAWGFAYKQTLVWHKTGNPSPFGGSVAPNHAEFLLVGSAGSPELLTRLAGSVVAAPKPYSHSFKPDVFLDLVEQVSPGPYLELFARRQRLGWDTWGNEALEHVEVTA